MADEDGHNEEYDGDDRNTKVDVEESPQKPEVAANTSAKTSLNLLGFIGPGLQKLQQIIPIIEESNPELRRSFG